MEFQHRMLRATVGGVVDKALREIPRDPRRALRNLADMGASCVKGEMQKAVFTQVSAALAVPSSPYYALASRLLRQVSPACLRAFGVNLGASSFTWGVGLLRRKEIELGKKRPWLILLEGSAMPAPTLIREANAFGCYTFILRGMPLTDAPVFAQTYPESAFFGEFSAGEITPDTAARCSSAANLAVSVDVSDGKNADTAFARLRETRCLFGFKAECTGENFAAVTAGRFLDRMLAAGCLFGCYHSDETTLAQNLTQMITASRGAQKGRPLLLFDLCHDAQYVANVISPGGQAMRINSAFPLLPQLVPENAL